MKPASVIFVALAGLALSAECRNHIKHVHIVFSNHLDVGLDNHVISKYFTQFFPAAAATGAALRARNGTERLAYLTHSWLVSLYLDCPRRLGIECPGLEERAALRRRKRSRLCPQVAAFKAAVAAGDITWHALPHNGQTEMYDASLLEFAALGQREKITVSQRDVPGLTRAAIPSLAWEGVRALSVGVNAGSAPPAVPFNAPFWWRDEPSGAQLLAFWHPGGYSGEPVDSARECVLDVFARVRRAFPGARVAASGLDDFVRPLLAAAPSLRLPVVTAEIGDTWIHGVGSDPGKLSEFRALLRMRRAASERYDDPAFKAFSRLLLKARMLHFHFDFLHSCFLITAQCGKPVPEHTWGVDIKDALADYQNWANDAFHAQLAAGNPAYKITIKSWVRQRAYLRWAVDELGDSAAGRAAWLALAELQRGKTPPATREHARAVGSGGGGPLFNRSSLAEPLIFRSHAWALELSNATGAILVYSTYDEAEFGVFWERYAWTKFPGGDVPDWYYKDFGKPNATRVGGAARADFLPALRSVHWRASVEEGLQATGAGGANFVDDGASAAAAPAQVVARLAFPAAAVRRAGAPARAWIDIRSPPGSADLFVDVGWENKTATRLPETLWVRWRPPVAHPAAAAAAEAGAALAAAAAARRLAATPGAGSGAAAAAGGAAGGVDPASWLLYKLGRPISPLEVILNGSRSLHAISDEGVTVTAAAAAAAAGPSSWLAAGARAPPGGGGAGGGAAVAAPPRLRIHSLDAALVSPGRPTPFPNLDEQLAMEEGVSFALTNNIWRVGTNYPEWIPYQPGDRNMRFRFVVQQEDGPPAPAPTAAPARRR
eukprot:scaffold19.g1854.t1